MFYETNLIAFLKIVNKCIVRSKFVSILEVIGNRLYQVQHKTQKSFIESPNNINPLEYWITLATNWKIDQRKAIESLEYSSKVQLICIKIRAIYEL